MLLEMYKLHYVIYLSKNCLPVKCYLSITGSSCVGYKSRKWLSDVDSPDKSPPETQDRKSHLKDGKRGKKRRLPSPIPFATLGKVDYSSCVQLTVAVHN